MSLTSRAETKYAFFLADGNRDNRGSNKALTGHYNAFLAYCQHSTYKPLIGTLHISSSQSLVAFPRSISEIESAYHFTESINVASPLSPVDLLLLLDPRIQLIFFHSHLHQVLRCINSSVLSYHDLNVIKRKIILQSPFPLFPFFSKAGIFTAYNSRWSAYYSLSKNVINMPFDHLTHKRLFAIAQLSEIDLYNLRRSIRAKHGIGASDLVLLNVSGNSFDVKWVATLLQVLQLLNFCKVIVYGTSPVFKWCHISSELASEKTIADSLLIADIFIHARKLGESFGYTLKEADVVNLPIMSYGFSSERNQFSGLSDIKAYLYFTPFDFLFTLACIAFGKGRNQRLTGLPLKLAKHIVIPSQSVQGILSLLHLKPSKQALPGSPWNYALITGMVHATRYLIVLNYWLLRVISIPVRHFLGGVSYVSVRIFLFFILATRSLLVMGRREPAD